MLSQSSVQRTLDTADNLTPSDVLTLQRTMGNRAVAQLLGRNGNPDAQQHVTSQHLTQPAAPVGGVVQRAGDEITPLEDYGDVSLPKWWQFSKKSRRKAKPQGRMERQEPKDVTALRLGVKAAMVGDTTSLPQKTDDIGELYAHAQALAPFYHHTLGAVAEFTNGVYKAGPIKEIGRTMDKVTSDYTDKRTGIQRPELAKDLLRSSIVYEKAPDLVEGIKIIRTLAHRSPSIKIRNLKNKFGKASDVGGIKGYGDINLSLEVGDGYIAELQLHLAAFWDLKNTKSDHDRYEHISNLERAEKKGKLGDKGKNKRKQLIGEQNQSYINAFSTQEDPENAIRELRSIT